MARGVLSVLFLSLQAAVTIPGSLLEGFGGARAWGTSPTCPSPRGEIWRLCPHPLPFQVRALLDGQFCAVPGMFLITAILFLLTFHIKCFSFSETGNSVSGCSLHQVLCYFQVILFLRGTSNGVPVAASCGLHALGTLDPHMLSPPLPPQLTLRQ